MTLKMFFTQKFWQDQTHFQVLISACFITSRKKAIRLTIFNHHLWIFEEEHCDLSRFFLNCFLSSNSTVHTLVLQTCLSDRRVPGYWPKLFLSSKSTLRVLLNSKSSSILDHEQMLNPHKSNSSTIYARKNKFHKLRTEKITT